MTTARGRAGAAGLIGTVALIALAATGHGAGATPGSILTTKPAAAGPVIIDAHGTGYLAYESEHGDDAARVFFCKVPRGGKCTSPVPLTLPDNATNSDDTATAAFPVFGRVAGVVAVLAPRYVQSDSVIWTSSDGGATFSAPYDVPVGSYAGDTSVDDVIYDPGSPSTADYYNIASDNVGLGFAFTSNVITAEPNPTSFTFGASSVAGASLATFDGVFVEAFWTDASRPTVDYYWSRTGDPYPQSWAGPVRVSDGRSARLASGPGGMYLVSVDAVGAGEHLDLRAWNPSTHSFGPPHLVTRHLSAADADDSGGLTVDVANGDVDVAWLAENHAGTTQLLWWRSVNEGKTFLAPSALATAPFGYGGPARLALDSDRGFLTYSDRRGLHLLDLASTPAADRAG